MTGSKVKTQWSEYLLSFKFKGSCSSRVKCWGSTLEERPVTRNRQENKEVINNL